jgi:molybdenum cofactor synthesis domain-containing protein
MRAKLEAICISERKGIQKHAVENAVLRENHGIEGDAHAGDWHRQVSLLALEDIDGMRAKGLDLVDGDFGENLIISGMDVVQLGLGSRLKIGEDAEISVTQIGKVCHDHCAIYAKAGDCIMPRRGIFGRVISGGTIVPGDEIKVTEAVERDTFQCVVLTASDRCAQGETEDTAGPAIAAMLQKQMNARIYAAEIIPDDRKKLADRLRHYADGHTIDLVLIVGGTGFSPRDVSPEAIRDVAERLTPGLDEAMRTASLAKTPRAILSRAASGIYKRTLMLSLPGSERAATENLAAILPALPHGLKKLRGDPTDCGRPNKQD